ARLMSQQVNSTLIHQRFLRLINACNTTTESPAAIRDVSEVVRIPGYENLMNAERSLRASSLCTRFQDWIRDTSAARRAAGRRTVLVAVHSFTPVYFGEQRAVEIGLLHADDSRLADRMLAPAAETHLYRVERNEPYGPADGVT